VVVVGVAAAAAAGSVGDGVALGGAAALLGGELGPGGGSSAQRFIAATAQNAAMSIRARAFTVRTPYLVRG
jgi:hypothetical protein